MLRIRASKQVTIFILLFVGIAIYGCSSSNGDEPTRPPVIGSDTSSGYTIILEAGSKISDEESNYVKGVVEARLELLGASEYKVEWLDSRRITVMLKGIDDIDEITTPIGKMGKLEFKKVDIDLSGLARNGDLTPEQVGEDKQLIYEYRWSEEGQLLFNDFGKIAKIPYVVEAVPLMTGEIVENVYVQYDQQGRPVVELVFTSEGSNIFEKVTDELSTEGQTTGRVQQMVIVLDDEVQSAPTVKEKISGGYAIIDFPGELDKKEIEKIVSVIKAGALPVKLSVISVIEGIEPLEAG